MARSGMSKLPDLHLLCLLLVCCCLVFVMQQPKCASHFDPQRSSRSKRDVSKMPAVLLATPRNSLSPSLSPSLSLSVMLEDSCMA